jgi:dynein assembly factor with WDR repeat domains 1
MFSKHGDKFATASFDRTCNIWDTATGKLSSTLSTHKNAVFCLDFSRFS